jgi:glutamate synthase domain-containing protein 3
MGTPERLRSIRFHGWGGVFALAATLVGCMSTTGSATIYVGAKCSGLNVVIDGNSSSPQAGDILGETFSDGRRPHALVFTHAGKSLERKVEGDVESYVTVECEPLAVRVGR